MRGRALLGIVACAALTSGCAGYNERVEQAYADRASEACAQAGYTALDAQTHVECIRNTVAAWKAQEQRDAQDTVLLGVLGGAYANSMQQAGRANASSSYSTSPTMMMCPDGSYVYGTCNMAPDGSYVGGTPTMAPDGSYVTGSPRMAPNGSYVGGSGNVILCPDGSYVAGRNCVMTPSGGYIGRP